MTVALEERTAAQQALEDARAAATAAGTPYAGGVAPEVAWALFTAGDALLVDVRTAEERKFVGHVPESLHVPWATGTSLTRNPRFVRELEAKTGKTAVVLLLCRSGNRSAQAPRPRRRGFTQVFNVLEGFEGDLDERQHRGGSNGWRFRGLPWAQDDSRPLRGESSMAAFDIDDIVQSLQSVRRAWREQRRSLEPGGRDLPAREALAQIIGALKGVLFPMRLGPPDLRQESENFHVAHALDASLNALLAQVKLELRYAARRAMPTNRSITSMTWRRPPCRHSPRAAEIRRLLDSDVLAAFHGDPAAGSVDEVLLCYPGILAMIHHRLAHELYEPACRCSRGSSPSRRIGNGIDIHPGARIGAAIDHGTGVVIGETAIIGERVRVYRHARREALSARCGRPSGEGHARHPIVEDDVVIYAGATILGRVTIGRGAVIGGNVWLTQDVPAGANITQAVLRSEANAAPRGARVAWRRDE